MKYADFAVKLEEILAKEFTSYECTATNENDVGLKWNFVYQGVVCGYANIEENSDTYKVPTFNIGLVLHEINLFQREKLVELLKNNICLMNGALGVIEIPIVAEKDEADEGTNERTAENEGEEENVEMSEFLVIQVKLIYETFDLSEFMWYVRHLVAEVNVLFRLCKNLFDTSASYYVFHDGSSGGSEYTDEQRINATRIIYLLKKVERKLRRRVGSNRSNDDEPVRLQEYVVKVRVRPSTNQKPTEITEAKTKKDKTKADKTANTKAKKAKAKSKPKAPKTAAAEAKKTVKTKTKTTAKAKTKTKAKTATAPKAATAPKTKKALGTGAKKNGPKKNKKNAAPAKSKGGKK